MSPLSFSATSDTGAASCTDTEVLDDRILIIPYKELSSGVKKITITNGGSTAAFGNSSFAVYSDLACNTELSGSKDTANTTYTFNSGVTSGSSGSFGNIYLKNLDIGGDTEGSYTLTVTLTDDAGNVSEASTASIAIDKTAPAMTSFDAALNASGFAGSKDARSYPWVTSLTGNTLTLYVTEEGAGLQTICLSNMTVPTAANYSEGGFALTGSSTVSVEGDALAKSSAYTINTSANTITFLDSSTPAVRGTNVKIEITNVTAQVISGRTGDVLDSTPVVLTDFAGANNKAAAGTVYLAVDSAAPFSDSQLVVSDISTGTGSDIAAAPGYTNSRTVNLALKPSEETSEETYYVSGLRSITLTNGVFTAGTSATSHDGTVVTLTNVYSDTTKKQGANELPNGSITEYYKATLAENAAAPISRTESGYYLSSDLKTLYFYSPVMVNKTDMTVTNVTIANGSVTYTDNRYLITAVLKDFAGNVSASHSKAANDIGSIYYDATQPSWNGDGLFVSAYSSYDTGCSATANIYPHASGTDARGIVLDSTDKNKDGNLIRYFYTSAKKGDKYGAVLGIPAKDNIALRGYGTTSTTTSGFGAYTNYYYLKGTHTAAEIVASEDKTNPATDVNGEGQSLNVSNNENTSWAGWQWFPCDGADTVYSVIIADAAGNISPAYTFHLIQDSTAPAIKDSDGNYITMTYTDPTNSANGEKWCVFTTPQTQSVSVAVNSYIPAYSGTAYKNIYAYHSSSTASGSRAQINVTLPSLYTEQSCTAAASRIEYYATNADSSTAPSTTSSSATSWNSWIPYTEGSTSCTAFPIMNSTVSATGPLYLWLKDGCGNTKYIQIRSDEHRLSGADETWELDGGVLTRNATSWTGITTTGNTDTDRKSVV